MQKIYLLALLLTTAATAQAQRVFERDATRTLPENFRQRFDPDALARTQNGPDTLLSNSFFEPCGDQLLIFTTEENGFVAGTNEFGDRQKMQKFFYPGGGTLLTADIPFAVKTVADANTQVQAVAYDVAADGSPGNLLGTSQPITMAQIDTNFLAPNFFTFSPAVAVGDSFLVGFTIPQTPGDTLAAFASQDGCFSGRNLVWEQISDNTFLPFSGQPGTWGLESDLFLFAIVQGTPSSLADNRAAALRLRAYPQPSEGRVTLSYRLRQGGALTVRVTDLAGRTVQLARTLRQGVGVQRLELNLTGLPTGVYLYRLETPDGPVAGRLSVAR